MWGGRVGLYAGKRDAVPRRQGEGRHLAADLRELASVARAGSRLAGGSCGQSADSGFALAPLPAASLPEPVSRAAFGPRSPCCRETSCRRPRAVREHRPGTLIPNLTGG
jgi:hypothetical protein